MDDYTREMVGQLVGTSISGHRASQFLSQLGENRELPQSIVCDNGPEFTSKAMLFWSKQTNVKLHFIQPGKPTQNAFVESLNGKFRNDCLNQYWFKDLQGAEQTIEHWRNHYNHERPHSSLNYMTSVAFTKQAA